MFEKRYNQVDRINYTNMEPEWVRKFMRQVEMGEEKFPAGPNINVGCNEFWE